MPLPLTVAVPTVMPPLVHVVGAVACGPNTANVTVPVAPAVPLASLALIELGSIAAPVAEVDGAEMLVEVSLTEFVNPVWAVHDEL